MHGPMTARVWRVGAAQDRMAFWHGSVPIYAVSMRHALLAAALSLLSLLCPGASVATAAPARLPLYERDDGGAQAARAAAGSAALADLNLRAGRGSECWREVRGGGAQ